MFKVTIEPEPKFKIGDLVMVKAQIRSRLLSDSFMSQQRPVVLQVIEILTQTCHGGTQLLYACRASVPDGLDINAQNRTELELELAPESLPPKEPKESRKADAKRTE